MTPSFLTPTLLALLCSPVFAVPAFDHVISRQAQSCNTPENRACWTDGFDINTDYELSTPEGTTREFSWEITEIENWTGPDGVTKEKVMLVNNQLPGPVLYADWGDTISVTITNKLTDNGTSIHWHGLRQFHSNIQDGVNGVTECPLAPGQTKTYTFRATQYGTTWYHSHFSAQYGNGVFGSIHINGPASANYDIDLGVYPVSDYYYFTADQGVLITQKTAISPPSDNILFNGTNVNPKNPSEGKYDVVTLTPGSTHRLRLINPSVDNDFQVTLVGHEFTIISTDLVPIEPITTDTVFLGVGQRYDVLIDASQSVGSYWFNATLSPTGRCGTSNNPAPAAIFRYEGASDDLPTDPGTRPTDTLCGDRTDLVPVVKRSAGSASDLTPAVLADDNLALTLINNATSNGTTVLWPVNGSAIRVEWDKPVLSYVLDNDTAYPRDENIIVVDGDNTTWSYWIIQNRTPTPHPMHLHGHDFLVLGRSDPLQASQSLSELIDMMNAGRLGNMTRTWEPSEASSLNFDNPTRRDVTMLPALGWLVVAFKVDNPGNWLFHCHIAWHVSGGLSVDFVESRDEQAALISDEELQDYNQVCTEWDSYYATAPYKQDDSGI